MVMSSSSRPSVEDWGTGWRFRKTDPSHGWEGWIAGLLRSRGVAGLLLLLYIVQKLTKMPSELLQELLQSLTHCVLDRNSGEHWEPRRVQSQSCSQSVSSLVPSLAQSTSRSPSGIASFLSPLLSLQFVFPCKTKEESSQYLCKLSLSSSSSSSSSSALARNELRNRTLPCFSFFAYKLVSSGEELRSFLPLLSLVPSSSVRSSLRMP